MNESLFDRKFKVVRFNETGTEDVLNIENELTAKPASDEVVLKIEACGLNRSEIMFRQGYYVQRPSFPSRIGYEASGEIVALGENVTGWSVGDKVSTLPLINMSDQGVWAQYATIPAKSLIKRPAGLSATEAAAVWVAYPTAYGALIDVADLQAGEYAIISAASSSVGIAAIQIALKVGAIPIATTRTTDKRDELLNHGAAHVIVTDNENIVERVHEITNGKGARVIIDPIAGPGVDALAQAAAQDGIIVIFGMLSPEPTPFPMFPALSKALSVRGYTVDEIYRNPDRWSKAEIFLLEGFADKSLKPTITKTFKLDEVRKAQRFMDSSDKVGKVVIELR